MKKKDDQLKAYMGEDTVFNGTLSFEGTVRIDGKLEGHINTDGTLIVGETGRLQAKISTGTFICMGYVEGTITASKKIEIRSSGRVVGDVKSPALNIELGGILDGSCDMAKQENKIIPLVKTEEKEKKLPSSLGAVFI